MSASTTNILLQTDLTTSQLRNNARRFINNQKDQEEYYKDEAQKISQAAQQSIETLQRMGCQDRDDTSAIHGWGAEWNERGWSHQVGRSFI